MAQLDTRQEAGGMMGAVLGAGAEQYRREIGRRTRRGQEGNARNAQRTGGRTYGYRTVDGELEIEPQAAAIVREIFQRYADGESPLAIAAALNARRIPSPGSMVQHRHAEAVRVRDVEQRFARRDHRPTGRAIAIRRIIRRLQFRLFFVPTCRPPRRIAPPRPSH